MLDKKYKGLEKEAEIRKFWEDNQIYKFDENSDKEIYSIDTPPPTVNGKIHIGHIFSYSQTEMIARYKRLRGYNVFYPFGFDDNGLPSERLVEKREGKKAHEIGREEFSKLCYDITNEYEDGFKDLFTTMAISCDWDRKYKTVSKDTIKQSQKSFLDLIKKGKCYHGDAPALWCHECLTSIAQAELETKTVKTTFNYIWFDIVGEDEKLMIATTRPELLPAIVAVFVNPEDKKYAKYIGKNVRIPLIDIEVEILADEKVDMEKGTGAVMCCTFGDQTDIEWWRKYDLPLKNILSRNGKITAENVKEAKPYEGLYVTKARKQIIEDLEEIGALDHKEDLEHEVQVHERCSTPVEYTVMKQWFIDTTSEKEAFLKIGDEIKWYPSYMKARYVEWVKNVMWDWNISRQRYFGVPFPVWYNKKTGEAVYAREEDLPVNPLVDKAPVDDPENYVPETDVMDTWATSSITPIINARIGEEDEVKGLIPMSLRTNASDIIRTWDFYTIVKSYYHFNKRPWDNIMISGFVMAGKGEKISKSKGNSKVEPTDLVKQMPADNIRYWAGTGRLGTDIIYADETLKRGKKLANKIFNVSKFIEMHLSDYKENQEKFGKDFNDFEYIDKWIISKYEEMEKSYINYLEEYEVGLALNVLEKFFWNFCDNYIEIVKHRLYRPEEFGEKQRYSGQVTVHMILFKLIQAFSIYMPYITEYIYQELYREEVGEISIHKTIIKPLEYSNYMPEGDNIIQIIGKLRGEKTNNNVSLKTPIEDVIIYTDEKTIDAIRKSEKDFKATLFIRNYTLKDIKEHEDSKKDVIEDDNTDENINYAIEDVKLDMEEE